MFYSWLFRHSGRKAGAAGKIHRSKIKVMATRITATCCAAAGRPGAVYATSLTGHATRPVRCSVCSKEYFVDYNPSDLRRIATFEEKLLVAAQLTVDASHPLHPIYVDIRKV